MEAVISKDASKYFGFLKAFFIGLVLFLYFASIWNRTFVLMESYVPDIFGSAYTTYNEIYLAKLCGALAIIYYWLLQPGTYLSRATVLVIAIYAEATIVFSAYLVSRYDFKLAGDFISIWGEIQWDLAITFAVLAFGLYYPCYVSRRILGTAIFSLYMIVFEFFPQYLSYELKQSQLSIGWLFWLFPALLSYVKVKCKKN